MKTYFEVRHAVGALKTVTPALANGKTQKALPVLGGVLVRSTLNGRVEFVCTNLEQVERAQIDARVGSSFEIVVRNARAFAQWLRLADTRTPLSFEFDRRWAVVSQPGNVARFETFPASQFPNVPAVVSSVPAEVVPVPAPAPVPDPVPVPAHTPAKEKRQYVSVYERGLYCRGEVERVENGAATIRTKFSSFIVAASRIRRGVVLTV